MNLAGKIKKYGFMGSLRVAKSHFVSFINRLAYYFCWLFPINDSLIMMESEGDLSDNAYALYDYMRANGYLERYHVVWLVDDVDSAREKNYYNTEFVVKYPQKVDLRRAKYLATCRWYIYDHCNLMSSLKSRQSQMLVYLSHGWGYKAAKGCSRKKDVSRCNYITATGPVSAKGLADYWEETEEKLLITGYPRIDYFYKKEPDVAEAINQKWHFCKYSKVILWMPTFRVSNNKAISEEYIKNQTGLPIFDTFDDLKDFADFLKLNDVLLVLKLHHLQAELPVFSKEFDNIIVIRDEEIKSLGLQLYQIIPLSDALISDYSSISIDYLALNKPIVFTLDDYEQYNSSRGLFPQNAIDYMPGYHVYNIDELKKAFLKYAAEKINLQRKEKRFSPIIMNIMTEWPQREYLRQ